jgi:formylglycine-generating enzyme required for sulfatase activity
VNLDLFLNKRLCQLALVGGAIAGLSGCTSDSRFLVLVDSDLDVNSVPPELSAVKITAQWEGSDKTVQIVVPSASSTLALTLPFSFGVKSLQDHPSGTLTLDFDALRYTKSSTEAIAMGSESNATTTLLTRRVITNFVDDQRKLLPVFLARRCVDTTCTEGYTCTERGCVPPQINSETLQNGSQSEEGMFVFENVPPSAPEIEITPDEPKTGDPLTCVITKTSTTPVDGATIDYVYEWQKNSVTVSSLTAPTVLASKTKRGDIWKCSVKARISSNGLESDVVDHLVTIKNSLPAITAATITPTVAMAATMTLTAGHDGWSDADDEDPPEFRYQWELFDNQNLSQATQTGTDPSFSSTFVRGQVVRMAIFPKNGDDEGASQTAMLTISNTPPDVGSPSINPGPIVILNGDLECAHDVILDLDGDAVIYQYEWYLHDSTTPVADPDPDVQHFKPAASDGAGYGTRVYCKVRAFDMIDYSPWKASAPVTINTPPPRPQPVNTDPEYVRSIDDVRCVAETSTTPDLDGQMVTYLYEWQNKSSGQLQTSVGATLSSTMTRGGDQWNCTATPHDGLETGEPGRNNVFILSDDLIAYWPLDNVSTSTPVRDVIGAHPGVLAPPVSLADDRRQRPNKAADFRTGGYVQVANHDALTGFEQLTVCAWVFPQSTGTSLDSQTIIAKQNGASQPNDRSFMLGLSESNQLIFEVKTKRRKIILGSINANTVSLRKWSHVCGRYDGHMMSMYINGRRTARELQGGLTYTDAGDLYIGNNAQSDEDFLGRIDDVKLWKIALSESEICKQSGFKNCLRMKYSTATGLHFAQSETTASRYGFCVADEVCSDATDHISASGQNQNCNYFQRNRSNHPMNCITFEGAMRYCDYMNARVPTKDEWETEATGGQGFVFPWGNTPPPTCTHSVMNEGGNGPGCGLRATAEVCQKPLGTNLSGCCDLSGNVAEWARDSSDVLRTDEYTMGGSYTDFRPEALGSTSSVLIDVDRKSPTIGFRCVSDPPGTPKNPARSCRQILVERPDAQSGNYWIDVAGTASQPPFEAWCQMSTGLLWLRGTNGVYFTRTEITVSEFKRCVDDSSCSNSAFNEYPTGSCNYGHPADRGNHPMNCVNFNGAAEFCENWANASLPSVAQWLAESTANGNRIFPWNDNSVPSCATVVMDGQNLVSGNTGPGCAENSTGPVCSRLEGNSVSGLCDMWGNVSEWTNSVQLIGGSWMQDLSSWTSVGVITPAGGGVVTNSNGIRCVSTSTATLQ